MFVFSVLFICFVCVCYHYCCVAFTLGIPSDHCGEWLVGELEEAGEIARSLLQKNLTNGEMKRKTVHGFKIYLLAELTCLEGDRRGGKGAVR